MSEIEIPHQAFIDSFKKIKGAFSVSEGVALFNICKEAPSGLWAELGSHQGKSSSCIALAAINKSGVVINLIEPEFSDEKWKETTIANILTAITPYYTPIYPRAEYSLDYIKEVSDKFSFVFVDSGVHDDMVMDEVKLLEDKMTTNGIIAFHDYKNQFTAVERAYQYLLSTNKYEVIEINWPLIFQNSNEENNNSWHQYPELGHPPNFVGALKRK